MAIYGIPCGGFYPPGPNEPYEAPPVNPLPENRKVLDTGDAGRDGYTVLARASRYGGMRSIARATPVVEGPDLDQE